MLLGVEVPSNSSFKIKFEALLLEVWASHPSSTGFTAGSGHQVEKEDNQKQLSPHRLILLGI